MRSRLLSIAALLLATCILLLGLTAPVARKLRKCLDKVNEQHELIIIGIRRREITQEEASQQYDAFLRAVESCKYQTAKETGRPLFIVKLISRVASVND